MFSIGRGGHNRPNPTACSPQSTTMIAVQSPAHRIQLCLMSDSEWVERIRTDCYPEEHASKNGQYEDSPKHLSHASYHSEPDRGPHGDHTQPLHHHGLIQQIPEHFHILPHPSALTTP